MADLPLPTPPNSICLPGESHDNDFILSWAGLDLNSTTTHTTKTFSCHQRRQERRSAVQLQVLKMVSTTRSRGATAPKSDNDETSSYEKLSSSATKKSKSTNDKVYRKAAPKAELQQLQFPAKRKTVRPRTTRHSLPNPASSSAKQSRKTEEEEDLKQKTLTQMRWTDFVPSTFQSDEEETNGVGGDRERLVVDLTPDNTKEGDSAFANAKTSSASKSSMTTTTMDKGTIQKKQQPKSRGATNRGRKRRKTTGDVELGVEYEDDQGEEIESSSKYHTQTLTQMPSWNGLAQMVPGSLDEEHAFGLDDDFADATQLDGATPPRKKRRRTSSVPLNQEASAPPDAFGQPSESTITSSAIPETPHRQRATRTEIPSSQPSPFTPNLDAEARFWSPLGVLGIDRTPLKQRSTNVNAPTPTVRKRSRSEIPDSWSTVNGGMPSSSGLSSARREPLQEIRWADVSLELGENDRERDVEVAEEDKGEVTSQRTADDIIMGSDDEFEGFPDLEIEAPDTSPPQKHPPDEPIANRGLEDGTTFGSTALKVSQETKELSGSLKMDSKSDRATLWLPTKLDETHEQIIYTKTAETGETVSSTSTEKIPAPGEVTLVGSPAINMSQELEVRIKEVDAEAEEVIQPTPPACRPATQQFSSRSVTVHSLTPGAAGEDDETEPETPNRPRRRPSSSSAVEKETPLSSPQKTSPVMLPISQLGYKSQAFESQRVPFEIIQQMAPQTDRSDVIISADFDEVKQITDGACTHIFRDFRIPRQVVRVWIYTTAPVCQLKYMAAISAWKMPGDISIKDQGAGIAEFNANKGTKYAYELLQVYELNNPVSLQRMKADGWVEQAPLATGITYVPPGPLGALIGNLKWELFEEHGDERRSHSPEAVTVSQEVEEQLKSDIEHSTQLMRGRPASSLVNQHSPSQRLEEQRDDEHTIVPSSQHAIESRIRATPIRTKFSSKTQVVFAKPKAAPSRPQLSMVEVDDSPPITSQLSQTSQRIIKSTVRPSQATTMSAPSQSQQHEGAVEFLAIPDSPSPVRSLAADKSSSLPMMVDDSPIPMRTGIDSVRGNQTQSSSLGLAALLASSQGLGLAGIGGEQDSLMDDSKIRMPPNMEDVIWDSEGD